MKKTAFVTKAIRILAAATILFACFMLTLFLPHEVKAATTSAEIRELSLGRTYTCYDVTGDRVHDSFCYKRGETGYTNLYLSGKYVNRVSTARGAVVYWARLTNAKVFLLVSYSMYGGHGAYILQYKGGKFSKIGGSAAAEKYNFRYFAPYKVSGTSIYFKGEPKFMPSQFNNSNYRMVSGVTQFNWNGQSFQLKTRYPVVGGTTTYTTNTGFYTSTSNSSRNTKGIYIPRGATVKIVKIFLPRTSQQYNACYLLSYGGRTGWLFSDRE